MKVTFISSPSGIDCSYCAPQIYTLVAIEKERTERYSCHVCKNSCCFTCAGCGKPFCNDNCRSLDRGLHQNICRDPGFQSSHKTRTKRMVIKKENPDLVDRLIGDEIELARQYFEGWVLVDELNQAK